jgi:hypothetical protein
MHDNNKSRIDIVGETFEKHLQGVDAPGRRPNANRWEAFSGLVLARFSPFFGRTDLMIIVGHLWSAGLWLEKLP